MAQDCELLVELYRNADEGAIGAEELVDLLGHDRSLSDNLRTWNMSSMKKAKMFWITGTLSILPGSLAKMFSIL